MLNNNISIKRGNLFDSEMQTITNTVNTVGVMGAGIAKEFKYRYPREMFEDYKKKCDESVLQVGKPYLWKPHKNNDTMLHDESSVKWVLNFPTKKHWKSPSQIEWLENGLKYLQENYARWGITSLAMPALGCSLGGLPWKQVRPIMEKYLQELDIEVEIYEPLPTRKKPSQVFPGRHRRRQPALQKQSSLF